jgi:hypothetical protein
MCLDCLCGLPSSGVATYSKPTPKPHRKPSSNVGMVADVQDISPEQLSDTIKMHSEAWLGAINLR